MLSPTIKILSWFVPITIASHSSDVNPHLYVKVFRGQLLLTTSLAIYSQGRAYRPFLKMFNLIKSDLHQVHTFLLLGTGLGSALKILQEAHHCYPSSVLVDIDEKVLQLSSQYMNLNTRQNVHWRCDAALNFLQQEKAMFDLIAIDVFLDLRMPHEIQTNSFMLLCDQCLNQAGCICWNAIHSTENDCKRFETELQQVFLVERHSVGPNVFYICRKK